MVAANSADITKCIVECRPFIINFFIVAAFETGPLFFQHYYGLSKCQIHHVKS